MDCHSRLRVGFDTGLDVGLGKVCDVGNVVPSFLSRGVEMRPEPGANR